MSTKIAYYSQYWIDQMAKYANYLERLGVNNTKIYSIEESNEMIRKALIEFHSDSQKFITFLHNNNLPHLSYSQISSLNFCQYRYYLKYVKKFEIETPIYFERGRAFHEIAATVYHDIREIGTVVKENLNSIIEDCSDEETIAYLWNATSILLENLWDGYEIVAIEEPFALTVAPNQPLLVGIVDLILRKGDVFILIDHKTGKKFQDFQDWEEMIYPQHLQLSIYTRYLIEAYKPRTYKLYIDQYRWIKRVNRARRPLFARVEISDNYINRDINRVLLSSLKEMEEIKQTDQAVPRGPCFMCPYKKVCSYTNQS